MFFLMRTGTVVPTSEVAVVAKDTEPIWESMTLQPGCEGGAAALTGLPADLTAMLTAPSVNVIEGEKLETLFSAACARRWIAAVVLQHE
jgi:hypothetical protein